MNDRWEYEWDATHGINRRIPIDMFEDPVWYSYLHTDYSIRAKRYHSWMDYKECGDSDFCRYITRLYTARDMLTAVAEGIRLIRAHMEPKHG